MLEGNTVVAGYIEVKARNRMTMHFSLQTELRLDLKAG